MSNIYKLVVVGDGMVGKTALLNAFVHGKYNESDQYVPTIFETEAKDFTINGKNITLGLWDTGGQEEFDRIRVLAYPDANIILICYSVDNKISLENIITTWHPEITKYCPGVPIVLVGCKSDYKSSNSHQEDLVNPAEAKEVKNKIQARAHIECSSKTHTNIDCVFEVSAEIVMNHLYKQSKKSIFTKCFGKKKKSAFD